MKKLRRIIWNKTFGPVLNSIADLRRNVEENKLLAGKILTNKILSKERVTSLSEVEFKIFSQWGEDGIIQYLLSKVVPGNETFIEFGASDYTESNTRFLLINNNWKGLVFDSSQSHIDKIQNSDIYWCYDLTAVKAFITKDNINDLIRSQNISGDIGLLSIDVDGNDYWIWEAIQVVSPRIIICEYNSIFGCKEAVSIPYDESFDRTRAHHSNLYFGASLKALCLLAERKGYIFIGSNQAGIDAFFVRKDVAKELTPLSPEAGYVKSKSRESRDKEGRLTYVSGDDRRRLIASLKVVVVDTMAEKLVGELKI